VERPGRGYAAPSTSAAPREDSALTAVCHFSPDQIGAARNRGIDILVNEVSNRATPCVL